jgi:uncharacterized phage protein (TIGR02218 family)
MKNMTPKLLKHLITSNKFIVADLYTITLKNGIKLRYADFDDKIIFNGNIYIHDSILITSNAIKTSIGLNSDNLDLVINTNKDDKIISGLSFMQALRYGYVDDANIKLDVAFMDDNYQVIGIVNEFAGTLEPKQFSRYNATMTGKSFVQKLDMKLPRNVYTASCVNSLYGAGCKANREDFTFYGHIKSGSNQYQLIVDVNHSTDDAYYNRGALEFISGNNIAVRTSVKSHIGGIITLAMPLPYPIQINDAFFVYAGCDKTANTCKNKFNNFANNRAYPCVPVPETAT